MKKFVIPNVHYTAPYLFSSIISKKPLIISCAGKNPHNGENCVRYANVAFKNPNLTYTAGISPKKLLRPSIENKKLLFGPQLK